MSYGFLQLTWSLIQISEFAIGGSKGRIPWAKLQEVQGDFILPEYLPIGVTLRQFHHIRLDDANALLKHWTERQAAGEIPFWFKKVAKANRQGGRASEDNGDPPAAVPRGVCQPDARQQDTYEDQAQGGEAHGDGEGSAEGRPDGQGQRDAIESTRSVSQLPTHDLFIYCYNSSTHSFGLAAMQAAKAPVKFLRQVMSCQQTALLNFRLNLSPLGHLAPRFVLALSPEIQGWIKPLRHLPHIITK